MNPIQPDIPRNEGRKIFTFKNMSIQQRLPLFICILLLTVVTAFSWISYVSVRKTALDMGAERVSTLADKLSAMFKGSVDGFAAKMQAVASQKSVIDLLESEEPDTHGQVSDLFNNFRKNDTLTRVITLLDTQKRTLIRLGDEQLNLKVDVDSLRDLTTGISSFVNVGQFLPYKNAIYFPTLMPVTDRGKIIGYIVDWQLLNTPQQAIDQVDQLMGGNGRLYFGNDDGRLWTDLRKLVKKPATDLSKVQQSTLYTSSDGDPVIGSLRKIPGSKWLMLIELSSSSFLKTANVFLRWVIVIGILLVIAGSLGGWMMMRNITGPIKQLSNAATAIAQGDYSASVPINRNDELGNLAGSFNIMASRVRSTQQGLEQKVQETSKELQTAISDITEKEKSERKKDEFISIASHELKTPLTTIKAFFQIAVKEMDPGFKSFTLIGRAARQLTRMERLIEDLLDVSKINSGKMKYNLEDFDFQQVLKDAIDSVREIYPNHNLVFKGSAPVMFHGDKHRIEQVIINLINNAVKYSPNADKVLISAGLKEGNIMVTIKDFGIGIPEEHIGELFDRFYRIDVEHHFQGLGLGLFISSEIIKRHGGNISVESEVGKGSAFTFRLPVTEEQLN
jgi:signal transduction histidine kinase